jgi:hypothetical protein
MRKFEVGKKLVRLLREARDSTIAVLRRPKPLKGRRIRFGILELSEAETAAIMKRADREAGFMMFMPYALATALQSLIPTFERSGIRGRDFFVSVSVDLRSPETAPRHIFFNHLSFLFFRIPVALTADRPLLLGAIRAQMYEMVKSGFPQAVYESSMLMRILPAGILSRLMLKPLRGEFASLGLACVGKDGYAGTRFMGAQIANLVHMPMVPVPPGIGFFVNQYGGKMNVVLACVDGMLSEDDVRTMLANVRRLL